MTARSWLPSVPAPPRTTTSPVGLARSGCCGRTSMPGPSTGSHRVCWWTSPRSTPRSRCWGGGGRIRSASHRGPHAPRPSGRRSCAGEGRGRVWCVADVSTQDHHSPGGRRGRHGRCRGGVPASTRSAYLAVTDDLVAAACEGGFGASGPHGSTPGGRRARSRPPGSVPTHPTLVDRLAATDGVALTVTRSATRCTTPRSPGMTLPVSPRPAAFPCGDQGGASPRGRPSGGRRGRGGRGRVESMGGCQRDAVLSTAHALAPIVDAVAGSASVLVDGGIRRGWDVASCPRARSRCGAGRPTGPVGPGHRGRGRRPPGARGDGAGVRQHAGADRVPGCGLARRVVPGATMTPAIEVTGLHVVRGGTTALPGLDMSVRAGTITGLLGPEWLGKDDADPGLGGRPGNRQR